MQRTNLKEAMNTVHVDSKTISALDELMYTAYETSILEFKLHDNDDLYTLIQLVHLAERYKDQVPEKVRM